MNIVCLGCSYTAGMPEDYYSWPEKLAGIRKDDTIYNLAIGGASLILCLHILDIFLSNHKADKIVFQITHPHRFTSIDNNFSLEQSLKNKNKNYIRLDPYIRSNQKLMTVTPGDTTMRWSKVYEKIKFAKHYYQYYSKSLGNLEYNILTDAVKNKSDISFTYNDIPNNAKKETIDDAGHFNSTGHDVIAEWINNELERNIY